MARLALFAALSDEERAVAASNLRHVSLEPGEYLFRQGDRAKTLYLVVDGELEVRAEGAAGEHDLGRLMASAVLGQLGVLIDRPRMASIVARTQAELLEASYDSFHSALGSVEVWATRLLLAAARELAERLDAASSRLVTLIEDADIHVDCPPTRRIAELEDLRTRLFSEWSF